MRLAALLDTPLAFGSTYAAEAAFTEERWLARVHSGSTTWLALRGDLPVGSATSIRFPEQGEDETCLVGMWVAGHARGEGVADALVTRAVSRPGLRLCDRYFVSATTQRAVPRRSRNLR